MSFIQIEINRVYIRYEDNYTSSAPFNFGIALNNAKAITCNEDWKFEYVEGVSLTRKMAVIDGLGIFFDYGDEKEIFVKNLGE